MVIKPVIPITGTVSVDNPLNIDGIVSIEGVVAVEGTTQVDGTVISTTSLSEKINQGKGFCISTGDLAGTAGTEAARVLIKNPSGSGKTLKVVKIEEQCNTSTGNVMYRYYYTPVVTNNGTPMSCNNIRLGGANSSCLAFINPTTSSFGIRLNSTISGQMSTLIRESEYLYILPENSQLLINVRTNAIGTTWCINVYWIEE